MSRTYWEQRYRANGNSGAGSYGRLATFKAEVLNEFVAANAIKRVLELGCGDGNQLSLANYPAYVGFDVSASALERCRTRFAYGSKSFFRYSRNKVLATYDEFRPELVLSLDVIYHLVEDEIFGDYMALLFASNADYVIIYSDDGDVRIDVPHIRNRKFTDWIARSASGWELQQRIANRFAWDAASPSETSFCDFFIYRNARLASG
jgi:SAM-dependent methyltransferase